MTLFTVSAMRVMSSSRSSVLFSRSPTCNNRLSNSVSSSGFEGVLTVSSITLSQCVYRCGPGKFLPGFWLVVSLSAPSHLRLPRLGNHPEDPGNLVYFNIHTANALKHRQHIPERLRDAATWRQALVAIRQVRAALTHRAAR